MPYSSPWRSVVVLLTILAVISLGSPHLHAQITLDGTLGPEGALTGPDFLIDADLGLQSGSNLFHSFGQFNVHSGESATFTGPDSVENILSRVTGGEVSTIDGLLRSTIPDANLYLVNPLGILFGANARLDVQGSFHATTAGYIRLQDGVRFDAIPSAEDAVLTVAPPAAFGFLGNKPPGEIVVEGSLLQVPEGETLSLVGGDIRIENGIVYAPAGRIDIAAVASEGAVSPTATDLDVSSFERLGTIDLSHIAEERWVVDGLELANIDTSGEGGGKIFIRGGQFVSEGGWVFADTLGDQDGQGVDINMREKLFLREGSLVTSDTAGTGEGGDVRIKTTKLNMRDGAQISAASFGPGNGGDLEVVAERMNLFGAGILVVAAGAIEGSGDAGSVRIQTTDLEMRDGAQISTNTFGSGNGGDLEVVTENLSLSGTNATGNASTGIFASAAGEREGSGDAGDILVETTNLEIRDGAVINAATFGPGQGGTITVISDLTYVGFSSGIFTNTLGSGQGGDIELQASQIDLAQGGEISAESSGTGRAGTISIAVSNTIRLQDDSCITVETTQADAGDINLTAGSLVDLRDQGAITTSVAGGEGSGGNIDLESVFVVLNDTSRVIANASQGRDGNIRLRIIDDGALFLSPESVVDASSEFGISAVVINAAEEGVVNLPASFSNTVTLLSDRCGVRTMDERSSLVAVGRGGLPPDPEGYLAANYTGGPLLSRPVETPRHSGKALTFAPLRLPAEPPLMANLHLDCLP